MVSTSAGGPWFDHDRLLYAHSVCLLYIIIHLKLLKVYACFFVGKYSIRKTNSICVYGAIPRNVCDLACHTVDNAIVADNK